MAWDIVCAPFENGGLGFVSLPHMNMCLLLKHLSKLHSPDNNTTSTYLIDKYGWTNSHDLGSQDNFSTPIWRDIFKGLPFFRSISQVIIGNGVSTSFWNDLWLPGSPTPLATQYSALYSHCLSQTVSVAHALATPDLNLSFTPRLSHAADHELVALRIILASVNLNEQVADLRTSRLDGKPITTKTAYRATWDTAPVDHLASAIWKNYAPNKCRLFIWLAHKDRVYTNERRFRRSIATSDACPLCGQCESIDHLLFTCRRLRPLWDQLSSLQDVRPINLLHIWQSSIQDKVRSTVIMALLWNIWKRRNAKVFRNDNQGIHCIARAAADDLVLWSNRCANIPRKNLIRDWASMLFHLAARL